MLPETSRPAQHRSQRVQDTRGALLWHSAIMCGLTLMLWRFLCRHDALLVLLRQDVWGALAMAACRPNLAALSHANQVCPFFLAGGRLAHFLNAILGRF